jgi:hypothetical protein
MLSGFIRDAEWSVSGFCPGFCPGLEREKVPKRERDNLSHLPKGFLPLRKDEKIFPFVGLHPTPRS